MFWNFFAWELKYRFKRMSTWVYFSTIFLTSLLGILSAGGLFSGVDVQAGDATGKVYLNSPFIIFNFATLWSYLGMLIVTAIMLNTALRDFQSGSFPLYFTKPIRKASYLGGRFAGGFITTLFIFSGIGLGIFLGTALPILSPEHIGPFRLAFFLNPYLVIVIPNLFIMSGLFFSVSILTRKSLPVYAVAVVFLVGYLMALNMIQSLENRDLVALFEPLGFTASMVVALEYWTVAQKNSMTIPLEGAFLWNRLIWVALTALLAGFSVWRFKFAQFLRDTSATRSSASTEGMEIAVPISSISAISDKASSLSPVTSRFDISSKIRVFFHMIRYEAGVIIKSVPFMVIMLSAVLFLCVNTQYIGFIYGTPGYPVTYKILQNLSGKFMLFVLIIATFYAGEMIWRSRDNKSSQILDAMPVPGWVAYLSRVGALGLVLALLLLIILFAGLGIQTFRGYYNYELWLYAVDLLVFNYPTYLLLAILAITVQSIVSNKYMGHFLMIIYYTLTDFMEGFGLQHLLYSYTRDPGTTYSDMNGYGPYIWPYIVLKSYWFLIAALMLIAGYLFWPRGVELNLKSRLIIAVKRWSPGLRMTTLILVLCSTAMGGFIYYNTNILNHYYTTQDREQLQVQYEQKYKQYETQPQVRITDVSLRVELYPTERTMATDGTFVLKNESAEPVETVFLTIPDNEVVIEKLELDRTFERSIDDREHGFYSLIPNQAILPGETVLLTFSVAFRPKGFPNSGINNDFAYNGTFINNKEYFPSIGYLSEMEISSDVRRKKFDLPPKLRMAPLDDPIEINRNYVSGDADWINFDAIIGTEPDQIAITCGHLEKDWMENGRRYFHYRMDQPMLNFYPFLSARYQVRKETWNGVEYSIYYHPAHQWNVEQMMDAMKKSIDYYSAVFSPFQYDQLRIVEFPRYNTFAQSFANTIPYSESIGFVAQVTDTDIDYPFGITAHETAHQWWAHQVIGANVRGATMLSEMLAQYGELMMIRNEFPQKIIRKYLKYELENYLMLRSIEGQGEPPMYNNENQQYINYAKATMIMNLLQDTIGADRVNQALSEFLKDFSYKGSPYPRSTDLIPYFRKVTPEQYQSMITDLFERVVLYDNRVTDADAIQLNDGTHKVTIAATARKLHVEGLGDEIEETLNDWIEYGVLDSEGDPIAVDRILTDHDQMTVTLIVDREPYSAGIDPLRKLIDKRPLDNVKRVKIIQN